MKDLSWFELIIRWAHVLFGIVWIGHLYFFNFVQGGFEAKLDAAVKRAVIPELRPRALYWFRWGAAWTWITGILLAGLVYYMGLKDRWFREDGDKGMAYLSVAVMIFVLPFLYDVVASKLGAFSKATIGAGVAIIIVGGAVGYCIGKMEGRTLLTHMGAMFGTAMAMNVWMRIWPLQRRIITAIKNGEKPEDAWVKAAGGRSRTNTYLSVPLVFFMISNHYPTVYGESPDLQGKPLIMALVFTAAGFLFANLFFRKSTKVVGF
ncbi:MAG TPA: urate hydroxylase PuuD [Planctomycetota bacterium]|nr:urate hydroxylase PuuD [Planctomycetota bacterium]